MTYSVKDCRGRCPHRPVSKFRIIQCGRMWASAPTFVNHINNSTNPNLSVSFHTIKQCKKTPVLLDRRFWFVSALPIFPGRFQPSIFGANELNYCVRDGNRWTLIAINTDSRNCSSRERKRYFNRTKHKLQVFFCNFAKFVEI